MPALRVTETEPNAWLLDFYIDGQKLPNVTWDDVERWVVDGTGFPAAVGTDAAKRADLLRQVVASFRERWIDRGAGAAAPGGTTPIGCCRSA